MKLNWIKEELPPHTNFERWNAENETVFCCIEKWSFNYHTHIVLKHNSTKTEWLLESLNYNDTFTRLDNAKRSIQRQLTKLHNTLINYQTNLIRK